MLLRPFVILCSTASVYSRVAARDTPSESLIAVATRCIFRLAEVYLEYDARICTERGDRLTIRDCLLSAFRVASISEHSAHTRAGYVV